jgi:hypothetical protein
MGKGTIGAHLYFMAILFLIGRIAGTVFSGIEGAVAKHTVQMLDSLVAGIIFTVPIFKIPI